MSRPDLHRVSGLESERDSTCAFDLEELLARAVLRGVRLGLSYGEAIDAVADEHAIDRWIVDWLLDAYAQA